LQKYNRIIPVTTVEVDSPGTYYKLINEMRVDLFTSNCGYRDVYIGTVFTWDSNPANNFPGWGMFAKYYGIPLLVGEYGMHEQDGITADRPDWINQQIKSMVTHKKDGGVGYLFFEWNEEHLKPPNQVPMGVVKFRSQVVGNLNSTRRGDLLADKAIEKPVVYEAAKQGLANSEFKDWNYNANVYELTSTTQLVLDLSKIAVKPFPSVITTPPTIPGFEPVEDDVEFICFGVSSKDGNVCSGRGSCLANEFCSCRSGYSGDRCQVALQCYGIDFEAANVCSGGGTCIGPDSCRCESGYSGSHCSVKRTCHGVALDSAAVCSGHGKCTGQDVCTCRAGYIGNNCEQRDVNVPVESSIPTQVSDPGPVTSEPQTSHKPGGGTGAGEETIAPRESEHDTSSASGFGWTTLLIGLLAVVIITPAIMWLQ